MVTCVNCVNCGRPYPVSKPKDMNDIIKNFQEGLGTIGVSISDLQDWIKYWRIREEE